MRGAFGRQVTFTRDAAGQVTRVTQRIGGDTVTLADNVAWHPFGGLKSFTRGNGIPEEIVLDQEYRVQSIGSGAALARSYGYNLAGEIDTISDAVAPSRGQWFGYDAQGRLQSATGAYGSLAWSYDHGGNRLSETRNGATTEYVYQTGTSILTGLSGAEVASFPHDAAGRTTQDGALVYRYDAQGRLASVGDAYQAVREYGYLPNGARVSVRDTATGATRIFNHDLEGRLIGELAPDGTWLVDYVWLGDRLLARLENGAAREKQEGWKVSKRGDFSTDDGTFVLADDIFAKFWTNQVDPTKLAVPATMKIVSSNGRVTRTANLTTSGNGLWTGSIDLAGLSLSRGGNTWYWSADIRDTAGHVLQPSRTVYIYAATAEVLECGPRIVLTRAPDAGGAGEESGPDLSIYPQYASLGDALPGYAQYALLDSLSWAGVLGKPPAAPAPTVSSCAPNSGATTGGTLVTITGANFVSGATVTFGGTAATGVTFVSATQLRCTTPAKAAGAVSVVVRNPDAKTGTLTNGYTYTSSPPAPTVTSCSPNSGHTTGDITVTISGANFVSGATVTFGGTATTWANVDSATQLRCLIPAHAAGAVDVKVTNPDGQSGTKMSGFTYTAGTPGPVVSVCNPNSGYITGGTSVTVVGSYFVNGATVTFGGIPATGVAFYAPYQLYCTAPAHAAGAVDVVVTNPDGGIGTLVGGFTYVPLPAPTVSRVTPYYGPSTGGTAVTISGANFVSGATVTFGGTAATGVTLDWAGRLTCVTPVHAAGAVEVKVTNPDGQSGTLAGGFTYILSGPDLVYYYHVDHLGTPQAISNAGGQVVWEALYEPFGRVTVPDPDGNMMDTVLERTRFPGQYLDTVSGLHQNWWRDYDPSTGRYIEPDPVGIEDGANHLYVYSNNRPLSIFDEYGLWGSDVHFGSTGYVYGTYHWAMQVGLKSTPARWIAMGNDATDWAGTEPFPTGEMSRHFDWFAGGLDSRDLWASAEFNRAISYAEQGRCETAFKHLGKGLHSVQDKFAHRGWNPSSGFHPPWYEPPRDCWRLHHLRGWGHGQTEAVPTGSA